MKMMIWHCRYWVCWLKWLVKGWLNWFWWEWDWKWVMVCYSAFRDGVVWLWWKLFGVIACVVLVVGFGVVYFAVLWLVQWLFSFFPW